jgi:S-disulfanyl-L-cysteine oxidoreductase SoxD
MRAFIGTLAVGAFLSTSCAAALQGRMQDTRSTKEGVYTEAQAERGEAIYTESCAACHGGDLNGTDVIPALKGNAFTSYWVGMPVSDLFEKVIVTMPRTAPGSMTPVQTADTVAYMLKMLNNPAGNVELPGAQDALQQITIDAPAP